MNKKPILFVFIIISILIGFFFLSSPNIKTGFDHTVSNPNLDFTQRAVLFPPDTTKWNSGENGIFVLGVRNVYRQDKVFYVSVYPEDFLGEGEVDSTNWLSYQKSMLINSFNRGLNQIAIRPINPKPGLYIFRVLVCESPVCNRIADSKDVYGSLQFNLEIV